MTARRLKVSNRGALGLLCALLAVMLMAVPALASPPPTGNGKKDGSSRQRRRGEGQRGPGEGQRRPGQEGRLGP